MPEETTVPACTARHLHHVCIAVSDIESTLKLYSNLFDIEQPEVELIQDQGVKAALVKIGGTELEFIPYTHPILKAEVRLKDLSIPQSGGTEPEFIP